MKKILSILFCFALSAGFIQAQESAESKLIKILEENIKNLESEKKDLQEAIQKLESDTTKLSKALVKAEKDAGRYATDYKELKEELKHYKRLCDSLETEHNKLLKNHPAQQEVDRLRRDSIALAEELAKAKGDIDAMSAEKDDIINNLRQELAQLDEFKKQFIASLAVGVDDKWLTCSFATLKEKEVELKADLTLYEKFQKETRVGNAYAKLKKLSEDFNVYLMADNVLHDISNYNVVKVKDLAKKTGDIAMHTTNIDRQKEMKELSELLSKYPEAVEDFKIIITTIYNNEAKDSAAIKRRLEKRLAERVDSVKQIPVLATLYVKYVEEVAGENANNEVNDMTDPNKEGTIANQIYTLATK